MKMLKLFCATVLLLSLQACGEDVLKDPLWETGGLRTPESVLYYDTGADSSDDFLLVSEIDEEGQGGIAQLALDGEIINQNWVRGLNGPKGMGTHEGKLYVSDLTEVVMIDIASQEIEARIPIADSVFLNDVAVDEAGTVYVSDSRTGKVHRIRNQSPEVYLEGLEDANGLYTQGSDLYIGAGPTLWKADTTTADGSLTRIADGFAAGLDGIEMIAPGEFIVSCWPGLIYHVRTDGSTEKLLDTREQEKNTADIGWNPDSNVLYVPTFFSNSVVAYSFSREK